MTGSFFDQIVAVWPGLGINKHDSGRSSPDSRPGSEVCRETEETKEMRSEVIGLAQMAVRQQVEIFGGDQVSLNSLWRAVGSPDGQDPARWAEVAGPLLAGFSAYFDRLESLGGVDAGAGGIAVAVDLGRRIERSVVHGRLDEPRAGRPGVCEPSRFASRCAVANGRATSLAVS